MSDLAQIAGTIVDDPDELAKRGDDKWVLTVTQGSDYVEVTGIELEDVIARRIAGWQGKFSFTVKTLGSAIDSLKKSIEYNGLYNTFLLGHISEDEFEEAADDFMIEPATYEDDIVHDQIDILLRYTKSDFTKSELAEIFHATQDSVDKAVEQLRLDFVHKDESGLQRIVQGDE